MHDIYNILDQHTIEYALEEVGALKGDYGWLNSRNYWNKNLYDGAMIGNISCSKASPHLTAIIHRVLAPYIPPCKEVVVQHFLWHPLSGINMHDDHGKAFTATIYLTPHWNINWGGLLIYDNGEGLKAHFPTFNSCCILPPGTPHMVGQVSPLVPHDRYTLQIFGYET